METLRRQINPVHILMTVQFPIVPIISIFFCFYHTFSARWLCSSHFKYKLWSKTWILWGYLLQPELLWHVKIHEGNGSTLNTSAWYSLIRIYSHNHVQAGHEFHPPFTRLFSDAKHRQCMRQRFN